jgi:DNA-binding NtrC family response regulator
LQAKLLHVLQDGEFTRLGGRSRIKVDVRVVAATNVDIRAALLEKRLREDLYYRLSTVVFEIPPLRERRDEIPVLLRHFLEKCGGQCGLPSRPASAAMMKFAQKYDWPGNVRELENFAKRYLALGEQALVGGNGHQNGALRTCEPRIKKERPKARQHTSAIRKALDETNWNRKEAARILGISYKTLLDKLRLHALCNPSRQPPGTERSVTRR